MPEREQAPPRLRERRDFVRFWAAATVSGFGSYVTTVAIQVLVVLTLHAGAAEVGLVNAARWLPYLLFGVLVGVFVDRVRRRPLLVATDLARGLLLVAVPVLALTHALGIGVLATFMAVFGLMSLVGDAAGPSFVPRLVPRALLTRANARLDQSDAVAQTSGPALAGALVSLLTAPWAVLVDAASYLASAALVAGVRVDEPPRRSVSPRGVRAEAVEGLRWVYGHRMLRPYAVATHGWFLFFAAVNAILAPYALRTLGLSALAFGLAVALGGAGGVIGALCAAWLGGRFGVGRVVIAGHAATAVGVAVVALAGRGAGWTVFAAGELVLGFSLAAPNANEMSYRQTVTPDRLQGRTNTTMRSLNRAMIVVGAPLGGLLADAIGFRVTLWLCVGGFVLVAGLLALSPFRDATVEAAAAEP